MKIALFSSVSYYVFSMVDIDKESIKKLSQLCRLEFSDEELNSLQASFGDILEYIAQLSEVDVTELAPYSHMEEQGIDLLRDDEPTPPLERAQFLENSPKQIAGMVAVPNVMSKNV